MEGHKPAPDIGLGTVILAGMGGTVLTAVFFLLVSWAGFDIADRPAAETASQTSSAVVPVPSPNSSYLLQLGYLSQ
jgi:hypothetical protein